MGWWHRVFRRYSHIGSHIWVPVLPERQTLDTEVYLLTNAGSRLQPREVQYTGRYNAHTRCVEFSADSQVFTLSESDEVSVVAIEVIIPLQQLKLGDGALRVRHPFRCPPQSPLLAPNRHWHIGPPPFEIK